MDSIEIQKKYKEELKNKKLSDKVKVQIEKGKVQSRKKTEKIIASTKGEKARISSLQKVGNLSKKLSQGVLVRKRKPTGEKILFQDIRNSRPHYCAICSKYISEAKSRCFAHLLAKGMYPKYRLHKENIAIVCNIDCHKAIDSLVVGNKKVIEDMLERGDNFYSIMQTLGR